MNARRLFFSLLLVAFAVPAGATVWYVDQANTSNIEDGTSWATAFTTIQEGIDAAGGAGPSEVWVAAGTYNERRSDPYGSLVLRDHVDLYGGFAGTETDRAARDWAANPTIIDGATAQEGYPAWKVVKAATCILDGFTITGGEKTYMSDRGLYIFDASPLVRHCVFEGSIGSYGTSVSVYGDSAPLFEECTFSDQTFAGFGPNFDHEACVYLSGESGNSHLTAKFVSCQFPSAAASGIAAYFVRDLQIEDCLFPGSGSNSATSYSLSLYHSACTIRRSVFRNYRSRDGAIESRQSTLWVTESVLSGNTSASYSAGALATLEHTSQVVFEGCSVTGNGNNASRPLLSFESGTHAALRNCLVAGNVGRILADTYPGTALILIHCTVADNQGGDIAAKQLTVIDSIIRQSVLYSSGSVTYSNTPSFVPGLGNITNDPLFRDAANGDYSLDSNSPCIDAGTAVNVFTPSLSGAWPPSGAAHDMGAYEYASGPDADGDGIADSFEGAGDADTDGTANYLDLDSDADGLADAIEGTGDVDSDGFPNFLDPDSDDDGMGDAEEMAVGLNPNDPNDAVSDADGDGITALDELTLYGSDPFSRDTDRDGMPDAWEAEHGLDLAVYDATDDADTDGLPNGYEYTIRTDPNDDQDPPSDLYVSPAGDDYANPGIEGAPWATLAQTMTVAGLYSAAEIYGLNTHPVTVYLDEGTFSEPLIFSDDITVIGAGRGVTQIVGLGEESGENFVVYGADACALSDCTVKLPGTHGFVTTLLRIDNAAMDVSNVEFVGNDNLFSIGLLINGTASSSSVVEDCVIRRLHYGIHAIDSGVTIANNSFQNIYGDAVFVRLPEEKQGAVEVPFLGAADTTGSGHNTFSKVAGNFILNATDTTVIAENNDWGLYNKDEIMAKMSGPVDIQPFIGEVDDGRPIGCAGGEGRSLYWGDVALVALIVLMLGAARWRRMVRD